MRHVTVMLGAALLTVSVAAGPAALAGPVAGTGAKPITTPRDMSDGFAPIEARAAREAERQAVRNARFDAQVKRITGTICLGCVAPARPHPPRR